MDLSKQEAAARTQYEGVTAFELDAGGRLHLRKKMARSGMEDVLDVNVPAGKTWTVRLSVSIEESD